MQSTVAIEICKHDTTAMETIVLSNKPMTHNKFHIKNFNT